jgi:hypothetical protein
MDIRHEQGLSTKGEKLFWHSWGVLATIFTMATMPGYETETEREDQTVLLTTITRSRGTAQASRDTAPTAM